MSTDVSKGLLHNKHLIYYPNWKLLSRRDYRNCIFCSNIFDYFIQIHFYKERKNDEHYIKSILFKAFIWLILMIGLRTARRYMYWTKSGVVSRTLYFTCCVRRYANQCWSRTPVKHTRLSFLSEWYRKRSWVINQLFIAVLKRFALYLFLLYLFSHRFFTWMAVGRRCHVTNGEIR